MGFKVITFTGVCLLAVILSCSARPQSDGNQEESLPSEDPQQLNEEVLNHMKSPNFNEDDLESEAITNEADLTRRGIEYDKTLSRRQESVSTGNEVSTFEANPEGLGETKVQVVNDQTSDSPSQVDAEVGSGQTTGGVNTVDEALNAGQKIGEQVSGQVSNAVNGAQGQINEGINSLTSNGEAISNQVQNQINEGAKSLASNGEAISNQVSNAASGAQGQINEGINSLTSNGEAISNQVQNQINEGAKSLASNGEAISNQVSNAANGVQTQINDGYNKVAANGETIVYQVSDAAKGVQGQISEGVNSLKENGESIANQVSNAASGIQNQINDGYNQLTANGEAISNQVSNAASGVQRQISEGANSLASNGESISNQVSDAASGVQNQINDGYNKLTTNDESNSQQGSDVNRGSQSQSNEGTSSQAPKRPPRQGFFSQLSNFGKGIQGQFKNFFNGLRRGQRKEVPRIQHSLEEIQQLNDFLRIEMNNKEKFAEIFSRMTPDQVKKIRSIVLQIGKQTNNEELIRFGQSNTPRLSDRGIQVLLQLGQATYERLNGGATSASQVDSNQAFTMMKTQISNEQDFIQRLVNMIELQLSKAPQIDDAEFAEIKQITQRIKTLSTQVQNQLKAATNVSQLNQMSSALLEIQQLSTSIQQKVSEELAESTSQTSTGGQTDTSGTEESLKRTAEETQNKSSDGYDSSLQRRYSAPNRLGNDLASDLDFMMSNFFSGFNSMLNQISYGFFGGPTYSTGGAIQSSIPSGSSTSQGRGSTVGKGTSQKVPSGLPAPKASGPLVETPKLSGPLVETPKLSGPAVETAKTSGPAVETPKTSGPAIETPKTSVPLVETPKTSGPLVETQYLRAPLLETPKTSEPLVKTPKLDLPSIETPKLSVETPNTSGPLVTTPQKQPIVGLNSTSENPVSKGVESGNQRATPTISNSEHLPSTISNFSESSFVIMDLGPTPVQGNSSGLSTMGKGSFQNYDDFYW